MWVAGVCGRRVCVGGGWGTCHMIAGSPKIITFLTSERDHAVVT